MRLRGDKELAFENLLINMMNGDYNAYYEYKNSHNFLDLERKNKLKDISLIDNMDNPFNLPNSSNWKKRNSDLKRLNSAEKQI